MMLAPFTMRGDIGEYITHVISGLESSHDAVPGCAIRTKKFARTSKANGLEYLVHLALGKRAAIGKLLPQ
jgi:hypothetical protein